MKVSWAAVLTVMMLTGSYGCGLAGNDCGITKSGVTLAIPVDLVMRDNATAVQMCVAGGQCETQPLVVASWSLPTAASPAASSSTGPMRQLPEMTVEFAQVLPASVSGEGSDGPPAQLTMTLYAGDTVLLTARSTQSPVNIRPGKPGTCHAKGYWIASELRANGVLDYYRFV